MGAGMIQPRIREKKTTPPTEPVRLDCLTDGASGRPRRGRRKAQRETSTNPELDDTVTETRPSVAMTG
jgi:hypothetical protein